MTWASASPTTTATETATLATAMPIAAWGTTVDKRSVITVLMLIHRAITTLTQCLTTAMMPMD